ncbi:MATE family efflux transporter [Clostridium folliculivorans]|uniref:Multidrug export protein MepA n=1 Tax=Clostridium folliculivorans TaxID=2886038 RepID=A0A9W5Y0T0_9CLOT|nr:MATE family efflux transporter [Clostridium folliculivorans]GKU24606.1 MATE family efflux transporter [Clostridium folliculivorans]GKU30704.1 MATE family efflux transporter [Clostridium folliculivorans]
MDKTNRLGEEKISKLLVTFSAPAIIGMLVNAMYNVIDRAVIGHGVNELGIAGITIGFPIQIIMMAFGMLIGIGATSLVSIRLGEGKKEEAEKIMGNAVTLLVVISIVLTILGLIFLNPLLKAFGASEAVLPYARDYVKVILVGMIFGTLGFGMNNFIRADGNPKIAMLTMLISALINAILAPIFIFIFRWGMVGAGLATSLAQVVSSTWIMSYFLMGKSSLKLRSKNLRLDSRIVRKILTIGTPPFAMQLSNSLLNVILNKTLIVYGGDLAISGMGIINSIQTLMLMPVIGVSQGSQPIIGYNYGAKKYDRIKETLKLAISAATIIVVIGFILTRLFPNQFIGIFASDEELIKFGTHALFIFFLCLPVTGFQIIGANYFQAVSKMKPAMFLTLSRQVLILIPAILILSKMFGLDGVLYAGPLADFSAAVLTGIWLWKDLKHLNNDEEENENEDLLVLED